MEEEWLREVLSDNVRAYCLVAASVQMSQGAVCLIVQKDLGESCYDKWEDQAAEQQRDDGQSDCRSIGAFYFALDTQLDSILLSIAVLCQ